MKRDEFQAARKQRKKEGLKDMLKSILGWLVVILIISLSAMGVCFVKYG